MAEERAKVLVLGRGVSGAAAAALAADIGLDALVVGTGEEIPPGDFAFAVVSPGIALTHPWISLCRQRGIRLVSELQFGCGEMIRRGWKLLAVTGSKGKSSVVKVVADAINLGGGRAVACGNYGYAASAAALESAPGWAVVEVSSFMMETTAMPPESFEAAAVLNLQQDHLDRHGTTGVYHALKLKLLEMARQGAASFDVDGAADVFAGSWFDNGVLRVNAAAAVFLMRAAKVDESAMRRAFAEFRPLPHRMETVAEIGSVTYIDDSKATSLSATAAAVGMCAGAVRLIAGGRAKGDDPAEVAGVLTDRVKKVYIIGECADVFFAAWHQAVDCEICRTMEKAVEKAMREAVSGETVLLSPGAASFDQYENFKQRGEAFASLVKIRKNKMNKFVTVLGVTALVTLVGCKDPGYKSYRVQAQNDAKVVEPVQEVPAAKVEVKTCTCAPGTKHTEPCKCGAADCKCVVEVKSVPAAPVEIAPAPVKAEREYTLYIVQSGDYLSKISKKYNVTIASIKELNNLKSDVIRLGQKLKLPGKIDVGVQTAPPKAKSSKARSFKPYQGETKEYVVKSGDTLGAIAYGNGCNIRQLKHLNNLKSDVLKIGQKLKIPADAKAAKKAPAKKAADKSEDAEAKKTESAPVQDEVPAPAAATPAGEAAAPAPAAPAVESKTVEVPAPQSEAPATTTYVVQEGDDMTGILIRFGVSAAAIRELNNLPEDAQLKPGQMIKLPAEAQQ